MDDTTTWQHIKTIASCKWSVGWEFYEGKPMLGAYYMWYDGPNYSLHLGPLWWCGNW